MSSKARSRIIVLALVMAVFLAPSVEPVVNEEFLIVKGLDVTKIIIQVLNGSTLWNHSPIGSGQIFPLDAEFDVRLPKTPGLDCLGTDATGIIQAGICTGASVNTTGLINFTTLDNDSIVRAGNTSFVNSSINSTIWQLRVNETCPVGSSIRVIQQDGTVVCETDDTAAGGGTTSHFNSTGNLIFLNDTTSLIGIGTPTPLAKLHLNGSFAVPLMLLTNATGNELFFVNGSSGEVRIRGQQAQTEESAYKQENFTEDFNEVEGALFTNDNETDPIWAGERINYVNFTTLDNATIIRLGNTYSQENFTIDFLEVEAALYHQVNFTEDFNEVEGALFTNDNETDPIWAGERTNYINFTTLDNDTIIRTGNKTWRDENINATIDTRGHLINGTDAIFGNLNVTNEFFAKHYLTTGGMAFNFYDDGSDSFMNLTGLGGAFTLETDSAKIEMFAEANAANNYRSIQFFSKEAQFETSLMLHKALPDLATHTTRSLLVSKAMHNCSTTDVNRVVDCNTDTTGNDIVNLDDYWGGGAGYFANASINLTDAGIIWVNDSVMQRGNRVNDSLLKLSQFENDPGFITGGDFSNFQYANITEFLGVSNATIVRAENMTDVNRSLFDLSQFNNDITSTFPFSNYQVANETWRTERTDYINETRLDNSTINRSLFALSQFEDDIGAAGGTFSNFQYANITEFLGVSNATIVRAENMTNVNRSLFDLSQFNNDITSTFPFSNYQVANETFRTEFPNYINETRLDNSTINRSLFALSQFEDDIGAAGGTFSNMQLANITEQQGDPADYFRNVNLTIGIDNATINRSIDLSPYNQSVSLGNYIQTDSNARLNNISVAETNSTFGTAFIRQFNSSCIFFGKDSTAGGILVCD